MVDDVVDGIKVRHQVETSVGRVIVNGIVPKEVGFVNKVISKKSLRDIIADVIKNVGFAEACEFLDGIKNLGYRMAYLAGLSFNLDDIIIPKEKAELIAKGNEEVQQITDNYNMGFITDNERYNQVISQWATVTIPRIFARLSRTGKSTLLTFKKKLCRTRRSFLLKNVIITRSLYLTVTRILQNTSSISNAGCLI